MRHRRSRRIYPRRIQEEERSALEQTYLNSIQQQAQWYSPSFPQQSLHQQAAPQQPSSVSSSNNARGGPMNDEDVALFRQAERFANNKRFGPAYSIFRELRDCHPQQIEILFWIIYTTSSLAESRQTLDLIERMQPNHPLIPQAEKFHHRKLQYMSAAPMTPLAPALLCPYCGVRAPAIVKSKRSIGGWIWFSAFFLLFLGCLFARVPSAQISAMGAAGFFFLCVGIVGLFIIRKRFYLCGNCRSHIPAQQERRLFTNAKPKDESPARDESSAAYEEQLQAQYPVQVPPME